MEKKEWLFCDNDIEKHNAYVQGILVISFEKMKELYFQDYYIVVTPERPDTLICQLEANGIKEYTLYNKFFEHD